MFSTSKSEVAERDAAEQLERAGKQYDAMQHTVM